MDEAHKVSSADARCIDSEGVRQWNCRDVVSDRLKAGFWMQSADMMCIDRCGQPTWRDGTDYHCRGRKAAHSTVRSCGNYLVLAAPYWLQRDSGIRTSSTMYLLHPCICTNYQRKEYYFILILIGNHTWHGLIPSLVGTGFITGRNLPTHVIPTGTVRTRVHAVE
jgi:hypothetical protein